MTVERVRPGGRSSRVRVQAFDAVLDELVEHGYGHLRFDAVAARAGVHKTTLYRWWPTKAALVADALTPFAAEAATVDTGSLEGDLVALYHAQVGAASPADTARGRALTAIFETSASRDPELADIRREVWDRRLAAISTVLERAADRGEIRDNVTPQTVCDLLYGAMYIRGVIRGEELARTPPDDVLSIVLDGARSQRFQRG